MTLSLRPVTRRQANAFIAEHHAHHPPSHGFKFGIGCYESERLCGVVVVERPKARMLDDGVTMELTRVCTDRTPHAASKLIAAATRAAFAMGATRVLSYVLETERGDSYRAAGWRLAAENVGGGEWSRPSRKRSAMKSPTCPKHRWEKVA